MPKKAQFGRLRPAIGLTALVLLLEGCQSSSYADCAEYQEKAWGKVYDEDPKGFIGTRQSYVAAAVASACSNVGK